MAVHGEIHPATAKAAATALSAADSTSSRDAISALPACAALPSSLRSSGPLNNLIHAATATSSKIAAKNPTTRATSSIVNIAGAGLDAVGVDRRGQNIGECLGCHGLEAVAACKVVVNQPSLGAGGILSRPLGGAIAAEPIGFFHDCLL